MSNNTSHHAEAGNDQSHWYAAYTRFKCESVVKSEISLIYETYLPMQWVKRKWSDRIKKLKVPLIPSYVFVKFPESEKSTILKNRNVRWLIGNRGRLTAIPEIEIELIKTIEKSKIHFNFFKDGYKFYKGEKIEIATGPLFGLEGVIHQVLNSKYLAVFIPTLGACFTTEASNVVPHYREVSLAHSS